VSGLGVEIGFLDRPAEGTLGSIRDRSNVLSCRVARVAVGAETLSRQRAKPNEPETRCVSAFLKQYEARFGQHPLLPGGQAAVGLPPREVADNLNDLD